MVFQKPSEVFRLSTTIIKSNAYKRSSFPMGSMAKPVITFG